MVKLSKGQLKAKINEAMIKFEKEFTGGDPMETNTFLIMDIVLVRLKGVLTPVEEQLAKNSESAMLTKKDPCSIIRGSKGFTEEYYYGYYGSQNQRACIQT